MTSWIEAGRTPFVAMVVGGLLAAVAGCESYLSAPGEGAADAPVLEAVTFSPDSVDVRAGSATVSAAVDARTRSGIDAVRVVLRSPSGNDRLACATAAPESGDVFDGTWRCDLVMPSGSESGLWAPDSIAITSDGADGGVLAVTGASLEAAGYTVRVDVVSAPADPPVARITAPADGSAFASGASVTFEGDASDPQDGALTGAALSWVSSIDGAIGSGVSVTTSALSVGTHTITLTATDSGGATGSDAITVTVAPPTTADLSVVVLAEPDSLAVGDTLLHTVTVTNDGPDPVDQVQLRLTVDGDVLLPAGSQEGCTTATVASPPETRFECPVGTMPPGTDRTLGLRVIPQAVETLVSTASIVGFVGATDPDATDRSFFDVTSVTAGSGPGGPFVPPRTGLLTVFSERDFTAQPEVYVDDLDAGTSVRITNNAVRDIVPKLSPDGTRVAYLSEEAGAFDPVPIVIVNADGSGSVTRVEMTERLVRQFAWSPDGTQIAFNDRVGGVAQLWIANAADPTVRRQVTTSATPPLDPAWSPDGLRIAYVQGISTLISVRASDGGDSRILLPDPTGSSRLSHPAYSPDGSEIALAVDGAIWVVDVATGATRVVVDALSGARDSQSRPVWSPDGQTLLFDRTVDGNSDGIWAVPADGSLDPVLYYDGFGEEGLGNWRVG